LSLHPHNDPEDPSANDCNYNFPQVLFAFVLGFTCMFVLAVDEIQDFKGCPMDEKPLLWKNQSSSTSKSG
jgi:hypothetical protein|tara:strand:- start:82 stop:291 length:210 start_codon:yes stop_codon:yes gene_type:complete